MKKSTQKVLDPKKDVLTRLKHLRALLGEARRGAGGSSLGCRGRGGMRVPFGVLLSYSARCPSLGPLADKGCRSLHTHCTAPPLHLTPGDLGLAGCLPNVKIC